MHFSLNELIALAEAAAIPDQSTGQIAPNEEQAAPRGTQSRFSLFSFEYRAIRDSELKSSGWNRPKHAPPVKCPESSMWVDEETGELFTQKQVREHGITISASQSLRMIRTQSIIRSCPDGKRDFLLYMFNLRNTRGGLIIDLKTALDRWIDYESPDIHSTDRARKRKSLEKFLYERGILANNQTFTKDLQFIAGSNKADYLGEESRLVFALPVIGKPGCGFPCAQVEKRNKRLEQRRSKPAAKDQD